MLARSRTRAARASGTCHVPSLPFERLPALPDGTTSIPSTLVPIPHSFASTDWLSSLFTCPTFTHTCSLLFINTSLRPLSSMSTNLPLLAGFPMTQSASRPEMLERDVVPNVARQQYDDSSSSLDCTRLSACVVAWSKGSRTESIVDDSHHSDSLDLLVRTSDDCERPAFLSAPTANEALSTTHLAHRRAGRASQACTSGASRRRCEPCSASSTALCPAFAAKQGQSQSRGPCPRESRARRLRPSQ